MTNMVHPDSEDTSPTGMLDRVLVGLTVVWAAFVALSYLGQHPLSFPLSGIRLPEISALIHLLPGIGATCLAWFAGHGILQLCGCRGESALTAVTALPAGLLLVAAAGLSLGAMWGFNTGSLAVTILLLVIPAGISILKTSWRRIREIVSGILQPASVRVVVAMIILLAALDLPGATAPVISYDDQVYHLTITRLYREAGCLTFLPELPPANRPQSFHLFMTYVSLIGDDTAIRATNWLLAPGIAFALLLLLGRRISPLAGSCGALAFILNPQIAWLARTGYTDLLILYLSLAALFAAYETATGAEKDVSSALLSLAIVAGYAAQVKTSGAALAFLALVSGPLALSVRTDFRQTGPQLLERGSWFCFGLLILASPWYIRNWFTVGNPFYPHFSSFWTGSGFLPAHHAAYQAIFKTAMPFVYLPEMLLDRFGMGHDLFSILMLPWNVTIHGHLHDTETSLMFFDGQIGFIPLAIAPTAVSRAFRSESGLWYRLAVAIAIATGLIWGLGSQQIRFLMPTLGLMAVLAGVLAGTTPGLRKLLAVILIAALPSSVSFSMVRNARITAFTKGEQSSEQFLKSQLPFMGAYDFINRHTASDTHVLPLFEERVYYLERPFTWLELVPYPFISAVSAASDTSQIRRYLRAFDVDLIYLPRMGRKFLTEIFDEPGYRKRLNDFFASPAQLLYSDQNGEVWTVQ